MPTAAYLREWKLRNPERVAEYNAQNLSKQQIRRRLAIDMLGGQCCRCGFDDHRALQIDHVNGGGDEERRTIGPRGIVARVLRGEGDYQLLCANCNWIKRWELSEHGGRPSHRIAGVIPKERG